MAASQTVTCRDKKPLRSATSHPRPAARRFAFAGGVATASDVPCVLLLLSRSSSVTRLDNDPEPRMIGVVVGFLGMINPELCVILRKGKHKLKLDAMLASTLFPSSNY